MRSVCVGWSCSFCSPRSRSGCRGQPRSPVARLPPWERWHSAATLLSGHRGSLPTPPTPWINNKINKALLSRLWNLSLGCRASPSISNHFQIPCAAASRWGSGFTRGHFNFSDQENTWHFYYLFIWFWRKKSIWMKWVVISGPRQADE